MVNEAQEPVETVKPEIPQARQALVKEWTDRINRAREAYDKKEFKRMRDCMKIASEGGSPEWVANEKNYVVPILNRHINQAVAQLYAKNPTATFTRKKRRLYKLWDGKFETLRDALEGVMSAMQAEAAAMQAAQVGMGEAVPPPPQIDPNAVAMLEEVAAVRQEEQLIDGLGETLEILWRYFMEEQSAGYKQMFKSLVRRTKICGVGYLELDYQRVLEPSPDKTARIEDFTNQLQQLELLASKEKDFEDTSARAEELRLLLQQVQAEPDIVVREGPVLGFPRSTEIIVDPRCRHLKTFAGAEWIAREFMMTPDEVQKTYGADIRGNFQEFKAGDLKQSQMAAEKGETVMARIYAVQHKTNGQFFTICDGYKDFLRGPSAPNVRIERFWTIFPLVFNEIESEEGLFPVPDVWMARHAQDEYNRQRQALREHRLANRPKYYSPKGALENEDKAKLESYPAHAIIELNAMQPGQAINTLIQPHAPVNIDPNLYEVNPVFEDILRTVGTQEANLGPTSGGTATESSIAEQSRMTVMSENVDELDDFLSSLSRSMGQLMLLELTKDTVLEIAGPGAVWPETPMSRESLAKEISLEVKAGSSGRPNRAAELANFERAAPYLFQVPGIDPTVLARKYGPLLDIDVDELLKEGLPSIVAMNSMAAKPVQAGVGTPNDPQSQGPQGAQNARDPQKNEPQGQPSYPAAG